MSGEHGNLPGLAAGRYIHLSLDTQCWPQSEGGVLCKLVNLTVIAKMPLNVHILPRKISSQFFAKI